MDNKTITQVLVEWSGSQSPTLTWEDHDELKQLSPRAEAWGQASSQERGNARKLTDKQKEQVIKIDRQRTRDKCDSTCGPSGRSTRTHKPPQQA